MYSSVRRPTDQGIGVQELTHRDRVMHICVGTAIIGSDNGLSPGGRQGIIEPMLEYW